MLTVFHDSKNINDVYNEKHRVIEDLVHRDRSLSKICRTACDVDQERIKIILSIPKIDWRGF